MNFQPLYTTSRVVTAVYRTASTAILLFYLMRRLKDGREMRNHGRRLSAWDND